MATGAAILPGDFGLIGIQNSEFQRFGAGRDAIRP
jgi:hypothetical protein